MPIDTGAISRRLMPGLNSVWGGLYKELAPEYSQIFMKEMSNKRFEEDLNMHYFGVAAIKPEGESMQFDSAAQGPSTYYEHFTVCNGFIITKEAMIYDQYSGDDAIVKMAKEKTEQLMFSMNQTKELIAWNVLNRAGNSAYQGFDGQPLISTAHLLTGGGTFSNTLPTPAPLSELALEQLIMVIQGFKNDRGLQISAREDKLIVPKELHPEAIRILCGVERYGTPDRDINAMNYRGNFPGGILMSHYLTSPTSYFIQVDKMSISKGLRHFQVQEAQLSNDTDFVTKNLQFSADEIYSFGWTDPRGVVGVVI